MKYAVWVVRLAFAAWMIPAGLNHFIPLFPQPMGSKPLSHELIVALLDSHLFTLVKAVELLAGISVLTNLYTPIALIVCMPVSFCVFFWDTPLEGWTSRAAVFGSSVLICNVLLCLAHLRSYRAMFTLRSRPRTSGTSRPTVLAGRVLFGAWMLANGINHFVWALWAEPSGRGELAVQLMAAFNHSGLLGVAMTIELVAGALILAGSLVPVALCVLMPVSTCGLFWAVILDQEPLPMLLATVAFALNGLLMLAYLEYFRGALTKNAVSLGESYSGGRTYGSLFVNPTGRTARGEFWAALMPIVLVAAFYAFLVKGLTAHWCMLFLLFPALILCARRLHDRGHAASWLGVPAALSLVAFAIWFHIVSFPAPVDVELQGGALAVLVAFVLWAGLAGSQGDANRFGAPVSA